MCGLAGYVGVQDKTTRWRLVVALGAGIDSRGKDAAGYLSVGDTLRYARKNGLWSKAKLRFLEQAASGTNCMMHARYATHGAKVMTNAHPFCVERDGKTVLWGAHNGVITNADFSARKHGRKIEVDSEEIFELIADHKWEAIQDLTGYGVATWVYSDREWRDRVCISKLSHSGDIELVSVFKKDTQEHAGFVWASTKKILDTALQFSNLVVNESYDLEVGQVYMVKTDAVYLGWTGVHTYNYQRFDKKFYSKHSESIPSSRRIGYHRN